MVFTKDELHCDIFALILIIQRIFVGSNSSYVFSMAF